MFKIAALIPLLVAGATSLTASSMAAASPARSRHRSGDPASYAAVRFDRDPDRAHDRRARVRFDDRAPSGRGRGAYAGTWDDVGPRRYRSTWVALSSTLPLDRAGRAAIDVNDRGTFTQLRLQTAGGAAWIDRVIVRFADGSSQVADLDRRLGARRSLVEIPLDGNNRRIDRILVFGDAGRRGAVQVYAI